MHKSVLLQETIDGLSIQSGDVFADGTLGSAGHTLEALKREKNIFIVGIDKDSDAINESRKKLERAGARFRLFQGNFKNMDVFLKEAGEEKANKIILDLGLSSPQLDTSGRGFSFQKEEPLSMTMEKEPAEGAFTAWNIVNTWAEEDIANVIYAYGDERYARRIAKAIIAARKIRLLETTTELAKAIIGAVPLMYRRSRIHPATKTFQALRIAVNDELGSLKTGLSNGLASLAPGGRMAIISFHSLEDRIVKNFMKDAEKRGLGKILTKKPIVPSEEELKANPRSRSGKLRIFIRGNFSAP